MHPEDKSGSPFQPRLSCVNYSLLVCLCFSVKFSTCLFLNIIYQMLIVAGEIKSRKELVLDWPDEGMLTCLTINP